MTERPGELDNKPLPQHFEAEQAVLGAALIQNDIADVVLQELLASDFYYSEHQFVFEAMATLSKCSKPIDLITVSKELEAAGVLEEVGGSSYLGKLTEAPPSTAIGNVLQWIANIKEAAIKRRVHSFGHQLAASATDEILPNELIATLRKKANELELATQHNDDDLIRNLFVPMPDFKPQDDSSWLVEKLLRSGDATLITAKAKQGKSLLRNELARSVATGGLFLDRFPCEQGGVLLVSLDEKEADENDRAKSIGIKDLPNVHILTHVNASKFMGERFTTANGLELLKSAINYFNTEDGQPIVLVVIDTLPKFGNFEDMNDYSKVMPVILRISDLAHSTNTAFVMPTHEPKHASGAIGSTAFGAGVDVLWQLRSKRQADTLTGTLDIDGRLAPQQVSLKLDPKTLRWLATDEALKPPTKQEKAIEAIKNRLKSSSCSPSILATHVMNETDVSERTYDRARGQLINLDQLTQLPNGDYGLMSTAAMPHIGIGGDGGSNKPTAAMSAVSYDGDGGDG